MVFTDQSEVKTEPTTVGGILGKIRGTVFIYMLLEKKSIQEIFLIKVCAFFVSLV